MQMAEVAFGEGETELGGGRKLENLTLWQRVHEHLREEILAERLPPGAELQEVALARRISA